MRRWLTLLVLLPILALYTLPAWALVTGGWSKGTDGADRPCGQLTPTNPVCYYYTATTQDSLPLETRGCNSINVTIDTDPDEDGTAWGGTAYIRACSAPSGTVSTDDCHSVRTDRNNDASPDSADDSITWDGASAGRVNLTDSKASLHMIDMVTTGASDAADVEFRQECNP